MAGSVLSNEISREELKAGDHIYCWRAAFICAHHGIYIGDDKVIHFTRVAGETSTGVKNVIFRFSPVPRTVSDCPNCAEAQQQYQTEPGNGPGCGVIISCLNCLLDGSNIRLFMYSVTTAIFLIKAHGGTCTTAHSDPADIVLQRERYLLNHGFGAYSLFRNNCEDFAVYCKTGLLVNVSRRNPTRSGQIRSAHCITSVSISSALSANISLSSTSPLLAGVVWYISRLRSDIGVRKDVLQVEKFYLGPSAPCVQSYMVRSAGQPM